MSYSFLSFCIIPMQLNSDFPTTSFQHLTPEQQQYYIWYYSQAAVYQQNYYYNNLYPQAQFTPPPPKLSANQKRKQKLRQKKEQLEEERKQIGDWVRLECKGLINDVKRLEEQEQKRKQKKKEQTKHLIEIHKEIYKLREKMGLLKADSKKTRLMSIMEAHNIKVPRTKKPSRLKQLNQLFMEKLKNIRKGKEIKHNVDQSFETQSQGEDKIEVSQATRTKAEVINYPQPGKYCGIVWNQMQLREWVDHLPSDQLEDHVLVLINKLAFQQAMKKVKQPLKFKKRIVAGFNEVSRTMTTIHEQKRSKCLIIALNIKRNPFKEGTDDQVLNLIRLAQKQNIPVLNCSNRSKLGRAFTGKFGPRVSIISILNYQGCEQQVAEIINIWRTLHTPL